MQPVIDPIIFRLFTIFAIVYVQILIIKLDEIQLWINPYYAS